MHKSRKMRKPLVGFAKAKPLGDISSVDRHRGRVTGCVPVSSVERRDESRRERQVCTLLTRDSRGQLLRCRALLSIEQEELLSREGREQEQNAAPCGDISTGVDQKRRHRDVQRKSNVCRAGDLRDFTRGHSSYPGGYRPES